MKVTKIKDLEPLFALSGFIESACHPRCFEQARFADTEAFEDHPLAGEIFDEDDPDHLTEFYKIVKDHLWLLVLGYETLLTNCADPSERTLEFKLIFATAPEMIKLIRAFHDALQDGPENCSSDRAEDLCNRAEEIISKVKGGQGE